MAKRRGVAQFFRDAVNKERLRVQNKVLRNRIWGLTKQVTRLQAMKVDSVTALESTTNKYRGNLYTSPADAIKEIDNKYRNAADWGVLQTRNIIDLRAAFIINQGIKIVRRDGLAKGEAEKEIEWANSFLEYNNLDRELSQEFTKEAEIEGRLLFELAVQNKAVFRDQEQTMVTLRFIPWIGKSYEVKADPNDYLDYKQVTWTDSDKGDIKLGQDKFVYKKFGGRVTDPNEAVPKIAACLAQIEALDKALRDLRAINHLFAAPILNVRCETKEQASQAKAAFEDKNFKLHKAFINTALEVAYISPPTAGIANLIEEILVNAKMISGQTGIPVHFLGLLDLLKNRATGVNTRELIIYTTTKDRETWKGAYEEVLTKAMYLANKASGSVQMSKGYAGKLDPSKIKVEIPVVTEEQWQHIKDVYFPARVSGEISKRTFLSQIPGVDVEKELEEQEASENVELEKTKLENEDLKREKQFGQQPVDQKQIKSPQEE